MSVPAAVPGIVKCGGMAPAYPGRVEGGRGPATFTESPAAGVCVWDLGPSFLASSLGRN